jgi:hypothetical protein
MNWSGSTAVVANAAPKKKRNLLPLLTVVFVISYALMTMLIVEQGAAIQSQSNLIKILLPDSRELWGLKGKAIADKQAAKTRADAQPQGQPQAPSAQAPSHEASPAQAPAAHAQSHTGKTAKPQVQFPPIPASDLDPRRSVRTI